MEKQSEIVNRAADKLQTAQVRESQTEQGFVRVDIHRLDKLMNLVGELVIDRTRLLLLNNLLSSKYEKDGDIDALQEIGTRLARITMELQEEIMKTRMVTVRQVFRSFPPVVRVLAQGCGKEIELVMEGEDTELDRTIVEVLHDPLAHLISNGVEQGIESPEERIKAGKPAVGKIFLRAKHQGNYVIIEVEDDGRGIDYDQAGNHVNFTGRDSVMDKVRKSIEDVNGTVQVSAVPGKGTKCTVRLPLTLAVISALLVKCCGETYAIPLAQIREVLLVEKGQIDTIQEKEAILVRGEMLPLARLSGLLYDISDSRDKKEEYTVVVNLPEGAVGLIVDELIGEQEIELRGIGSEIYLPHVKNFAPENIPALRKKLTRLNLEIPCLTTGAFLFDETKIEEAKKEVSDYITLAKALGTPYVRVLGDRNPEPGPVNESLVEENLHELLPQAAKNNVTLLLETNGVYAESSKLARLLEKINHPHLACLWDVHHPYRYFEEPVQETYSTLKPWIKHIHIKDSLVKDGKICYRMFGHGDIPLADVIKILSENDYQGYVVLEWVKRWCMDLEEPGIVFTHYLNAVKNMLP